MVHDGAFIQHSMPICKTDCPKDLRAVTRDILHNAHGRGDRSNGLHTDRSGHVQCCVKAFERGCKIVDHPRLYPRDENRGTETPNFRICNDALAEAFGVIPRVLPCQRSSLFPGNRYRRRWKNRTRPCWELVTMEGLNKVV